jgi:hypothetical protein
MPNSTSAEAPATTQIASGTRNGLMVPPAVAKPTMLQALMMSCGAIGTQSSRMPSRIASTKVAPGSVSVANGF